MIRSRAKTFVCWAALAWLVALPLSLWAAQASPQQPRYPQPFPGSPGQGAMPAPEQTPGIKEPKTETREVEQPSRNEPTAQQRLPAEPEHSATARALRMIHLANGVMVRAGHLAARRAAEPRVRALGERAWRDHQFADARIRTLAKALGVQLDLASGAAGTASSGDGGPAPSAPQPQMQVRRSMQQVMPELQQVQGAAFDEHYLRMVVSSHQQMRQQLEPMVPQVDLPKARHLIEELLPILGQHVALAQQLLDTTRSEPARGDATGGSDGHGAR